MALCYRCVSLFVELWSLLTSAVVRRAKGSVSMASPDPYFGRLQQLEAMVHPALPGLTMQVVSARPVDQNEMSDSGTTPLIESMFPSESTKLKICSNVLHVWEKRWHNQAHQGSSLQGTTTSAGLTAKLAELLSKYAICTFGTKLGWAVLACECLARCCGRSESAVRVFYVPSLCMHLPACSI